VDGGIGAQNRIVENSVWSKDPSDEVMKYGRIEEASSVSLSKVEERGEIAVVDTG